MTHTASLKLITLNMLTDIAIINGVRVAFYFALKYSKRKTVIPIRYFIYKIHAHFCNVCITDDGEVVPLHSRMYIGSCGAGSLTILVYAGREVTKSNLNYKSNRVFNSNIFFNFKFVDSTENDVYFIKYVSAFVMHANRSWVKLNRFFSF